LKRFTFRLKKVMELRKWRERFSQQRLAEAQTDRDRARGDLDRTRGELNDHYSERRHHAKSSITAGTALAEATYSQRLLKEEADSMKKVEKNERNVKKCREDLIEKSREKKVLEKLHDRRYDEYQISSKRQAQKVLDDEAANRHHRALDPEKNSV